MAKRRIFVAVDVSARVRSGVGAYIAALRSEFEGAKVRWVDPEKIHITLKFAGHIGPEQLSRLDVKVAAVARRCPPFQMNIEGTGAFRKRNRSSVLWLGVKFASPSGIQDRFNDLVAALNDDPGESNKTEFKPHLTIARLQGLPNEPAVVGRHLDSTFNPARFNVEEVVVYESELMHGGSRYTAIARHRLSGPP